MKKRDHLPALPNSALSSFRAGRMKIYDPEEENAWIVGDAYDIEQ